MEEIYEPATPAKSSPDNDIEETEGPPLQQEDIDNFFLDKNSNNISSQGFVQTSIESLDSGQDQTEKTFKEPNPALSKRWKAFMVGTILSVSVIFTISVYLLDCVSEGVITLSVMILSILTSVFGVIVSLFGGSFFKYLVSVAIFLIGTTVLFVGILHMTEYSVQSMYESFKNDPEVFMEKHKCQCWNDVETPDECINISKTSCEEIVATNGLIGFILSALGFCAMICASVFLTIGHHLLAYERKKRKFDLENPMPRASNEGYRRYIDIMDPPASSFNQNTDSVQEEV